MSGYLEIMAINREWSPSGITEWEVFVLQDATKKHLTCTLESFGISVENNELFIQKIEQAVTNYHLMQKIASDSKPSSVRKNLLSAQKKALELNEKLNNLDANSRLLIEEISSKGIQGVYSNLSEVIAVLGKALSAAHEYPKRGRLVEYDKLNLGLGIAGAIQSVLGLKPSCTKDGLLEQCYSIVYQDITGESFAGVHTMIERIIAELPNN